MKARIKSITFARIKMVVGHVGQPDKGGIVDLLERIQDGDFRLYVPEEAAMKISSGDEVEALCILANDLSMGDETLVVAKRIEGALRGIYETNSFWEEQFHALGGSE